MAKRRKLRKCRICKKSPVWRGGDVKNPGPFCKKCYHKKVWIHRPGVRNEQSVADDFGFSESLSEPFDVYSESLLGLPLGPDEEEWKWICRTARGESESRREPSPPEYLYPDEDDWEWICRTYQDE